ncbi:zonular occludens toxin domain-containing protein [Cupriavidus metallidurans]|uniref:zonular occludens toxin domain-containing protein n=1 Tax=Cupriavidus metallidurans TaxID=119219 RepID=UPI0035C6A489
MAIYMITGRLGSGKSLCAVGRIRDAVIEGRRVATNLDLNLDKLLNRDARQSRVIRLPDKPSVSHLDCIGRGNESYDETKNGIIVLDELAALLNARNWQDSKQQALITWLIHSRKKGWDVYFICQHESQADRQVRDALVEYLVTCRRLDRLGIPFVSRLVETVSLGKFKPRLPRLHMAIVKYGTDYNSVVAERWFYRANDLFDAYDTRQVFEDRDDQAPFSYLPPWYTVGRLGPQKVRGIKAQMAERRRLTELQRQGTITFDQWREYMRMV